MNTPDPPHWTLNSCIAAFQSVWLYFGLFHYSTKLGAKWVELVQLNKSSGDEVASEFFTTNAPDPHHWTLNACFGVSHSIWVHLEMFRYYTKLGEKRVELVQLMQKFVP